MPQLPKAQAEAAATAATEGGYVLLDPGVYLARCIGVTAETSSNNNPMWVWEYEILSTPGKGRRIRNYTALTDAAMFKVAETFAAYGVPTDTHTDTLIGVPIALNITIEKISKGTRQGQDGNTISMVLPASAYKGADSGGGSESAFAESGTAVGGGGGVTSDPSQIEF